MKLIFLYGPPASGKLTIADKLSKQTGIPLFHNHLSRDLVEHLYGDTFRLHYDLVDTIRYDVIDYCAKHNTDLIFTYVYEGKDDDYFIRRVVEIVESNNGEVVFVELTASPDDLIARVDSESRKAYGKLVDPVKMTKIIEDMSKYSIPYVQPIRINTSTSDLGAAVSDILRHL